jgi:putative ABC transport system permease protein
VAALATAALGMLSTLLMTLLERRREIGLWRALGAEERTVTALLLAEGAILGVAGGVAGWIAGQGLGTLLSGAIFGRPLEVSGATLPLALATALAIVLLASWLPVRAAVRRDPVAALRG